MAGFEDEYNKRLRRVAGLYDDSVEVRIEGDVTEGYWDGYCETCRYYNEGEPFIKIMKVIVNETFGWEDTVELVRFDDMGELLRKMDAVDLDAEV